MRINLKDIEENIKPLGGKLSYDKNFIFELLGVYGRSPANITRLKSGQLNVADDKDNDVAQKNVVYFKPEDVSDDELYAIVDDLKSSPTVVRYSTRFVIATNYHKLRAIDTKTNESLDIDMRDIDRHFTFFLPWAGMEKTQFIAENHADVKAAERMAKLFDILIDHNGYKTPQEWHYLTTFFTQLLFCYFAEDTNIFKKGQFANTLASYTQEDGSDMRMFLTVLFESLDEKDKDTLPSYVADFPYVNGNLFSGISEMPHFNREARDILIKTASELDWSNINPDIFGSMFQAVIRPSERTGLGQHYTSVPNIMKTIEPLFLDELRNELNKNYDDAKKLDTLLTRISNIKIFDPACGSGNFLIIAYKELRRLEHTILERQSELRPHQTILFGSRINIENFFGIEIDDFAHEIAILSLWLAKHQMNIEFTEKFGIDLPLIPLKEAGNIVHGNSAKIRWEEVCPVNADDEVYLISNPPYLGARRQKPNDKKDMELVFDMFTGKYKNLDYVSIWFIKAAQLISRNNNSAASLVANNSISQGQQVEIIWPLILQYGVSIDYAYTSFRWTNNAKHEAKVTCVIIAFSRRVVPARFIEDTYTRNYVNEIDPYLREKTTSILIGSRSKPIANLPTMTFGSMANDKGNLIFSIIEKDAIVGKYPESKVAFKKYVGAEEYIKGRVRWCLWLDEDTYNRLRHIPEIAEAVAKTRAFRLDSNRAATNKLAEVPYKFGEARYKPTTSIIIPRTSSEKRSYIPIGYLDKDVVISDAALAVYDAKPYIFGLLTSRMHMVWVRAVAGRLKTDLRYSAAIVYNNFPVPILQDEEIALIEERAFGVLDARESHPDKSIAELYSISEMPVDLKAAHEELDDLIDKIYRKKPFDSDNERLALLFDMYGQLAGSEKEVS